MVSENSLGSPPEVPKSTERLLEVQSLTQNECGRNHKRASCFTSPDIPWNTRQGSCFFCSWHQRLMR
jgi:hypothetical protein